MSDRSPAPVAETERPPFDPGCVLIVACDAAVEVLIRECVRRMDRPITAVAARDEAGALATLENTLFDCAIVDCSREGDGDLVTVHSILDLHPDLPVVLLLEDPAGDLMTRSLQAGVSDVIFTGTLDHDLIAAVIERNAARRRRALEFQAVRRELEHRNRELEEKDRILSARVQELLEIQGQSLFRGYEVDRLNRLLESLRGMAEATVDAPETGPPFPEILQQVTSAVDVEFGLLFRVKGRAWSLEATAGYPESAVKWFRSRDPREVFPAEGLDVTRARESKRDGNLLDPERALGVQSRLVSRLSAGGREVGILVLASKTYERFSQGEVAMVRACEHHLAIALSFGGSLSDGNPSY